MLSKEIIKKIAEIEIHTKRILSSTLMGDSRSAQRGSGFEFNQIRDYMMGDDVRFIDWRASARADKMLVKEYIEERNRTVMILLDMSRSMNFTSQETDKEYMSKQIAAVLALVAGYSKDRVGLILYTDHVEAVIPPGSGHSHVHLLLEKIFSLKPQGVKTNISAAFDKLIQIKKRNVAVFVITDGIDENMGTVLKKASFRYEIVLIRSGDPMERHIPFRGFLPVKDIETGQEAIIDVRSFKRNKLQNFLEHQAAEQVKLMKKYDIECLDIINHETFIDDVIRFFRRRMAY